MTGTYEEPMVLPSKITTSYWLEEKGVAGFVDALPLLFGEHLLSTTITPQEKSEACCVTIAIDGSLDATETMLYLHEQARTYLDRSLDG